MNYEILKKKVMRLEKELAQAKSKLRGIDGYQYIKDVESYHSGEWLVSDHVKSNSLASLLTIRDYPMSREDIIKVFKCSGYKYGEQHIDNAKPDSREAINEYIRLEQVWI